MPFVLRLFFLQVHQTKIPATVIAATDPNTAPTTIPMAPTIRNKLQGVKRNSTEVYFYTEKKMLTAVKHENKAEKRHT